MKRELAALSLLLLLILAAIGNLHRADALVDRVEHSLDLAEQAAQEGDFGAALSHLEAGKRCWNSRESYTQVFFRHPDLDALQDAFSQLEQALRQQDESWPAMLTLLRYHLRMLDQMEHLSWGTVF